MPDKITQDQVRRVAMLSRLELTDDQVAHFTDQLGAILGYIDKLAELDVTDVEPMAHPLDMTNVFREDAETPGVSVDSALHNTAERFDPFFKVPKVLGDDGGA